MSRALHFSTTAEFQINDLKIPITPKQLGTETIIHIFFGMLITSFFICEQMFKIEIWP